MVVALFMASDVLPFLECRRVLPPREPEPLDDSFFSCMIRRRCLSASRSLYLLTSISSAALRAAAGPSAALSSINIAARARAYSAPMSLATTRRRRPMSLSTSSALLPIIKHGALPSGNRASTPGNSSYDSPSVIAYLCACRGFVSLCRGALGRQQETYMTAKASAFACSSSASCGPGRSTSSSSHSLPSTRTVVS